jgi:hypothetical protein
MASAFQTKGLDTSLSEHLVRILAVQTSKANAPKTHTYFTLASPRQDGNGVIFSFKINKVFNSKGF